MDFEIFNHGTIAVVYANTQAAKSFLDENFEIESWQWDGGGLVIDPRCADDMINILESNCFNVGKH